MSEGHVTQLQQTVDRMLKESRDRMETHANERRQLSEEKVSRGGEGGEGGLYVHVHVLLFS